MTNSSKPLAETASRTTTLVAAGLLLAALAVVVLYTSRRAFLSPMALVVIAAIGVAALLLQLRMRPTLSSASSNPARSPLWLNVLGVVFAVAAGAADLFHLDGTLVVVAALAAVVSFAVSGVIVLNALRKRRA